MTNYKILASDLDGTLLLPDMTVSRENSEAINTLTRMGVYFVPASGRTLTCITPEVLSRDDVRYIIYSDGAAVYDKLERRAIIKNTISRENSCELMDIFEKYGSLPLLHYNGCAYTDEEQFSKSEHDRHRMSKYFSDFIFSNCKPTRDFHKFCREIEEAELFVVFFESEEQLNECRKRIDAIGKYTTVQSERTNIEVYMKNAGKGNALIHLADYLGVPREATVAVGDSTNDMQMVTMAGLGLAVENAFDELKAAADATICNHKQHAIAHILENYIKE